MKNNQHKVLAVIPARGGSKGVPGKNIRPVCGKPLIAYTIETALAIKDLFHRVIVSTDDENIAAISRQYGAETPFMRPDDLAGDKIPTLPVLEHAVQFIEQQDQVTIDWVMLLQPTSPFRDPEDLKNSIELATQGGCDSVISVVQVFAVHPILMKKIEGNTLLPFGLEEKEGTRRQDYKPDAYMRNGCIYLSKRDTIIKDRSIWGQTIRPYVMPEDSAAGVDSELDMKMVELVMQEKLSKK